MPAPHAQMHYPTTSPPARSPAPPPSRPTNPTTTQILISTALPPSFHPCAQQPPRSFTLTLTLTPPTSILRICSCDVDIWIPVGGGGGGVGGGIGIIVDTHGYEYGQDDGGSGGGGSGSGDSMNDLLYRLNNVQATSNPSTTIAIAVLGMERFAKWQIELYLSAKPSLSDVLLLLLTAPSTLLPAIEKLFNGMTLTQQQQQKQQQQQQLQSRRSLALLAQMSSDPPLRAHTTYVLHDMYPSIAALAEDVTVEKLRMVVGEKAGEREEAERVVRFLEREWEVRS